jgi:hypothetical protein
MTDNPNLDSDDGAAEALRRPFANAWAITTFGGFLAIALLVGFFYVQQNLYTRLDEARLVQGRQNHCLAVREACHDRELVPELCNLRRRHGLESTQTGQQTPEERTYGPNDVKCSETGRPEEGYCGLLPSVETPTCATPQAPGETATSG